jgi:hypothetical protein
MIILLLLLQLCSCSIASSGDVVVFCKYCGENITTFDHVITVRSDEAVGRRNESFPSAFILLQEFINPNKIPFEVLTVREADVLPVGARVSSDTFFPGYDWTIIVCPKCKAHIGWAFTPTISPADSEPEFYALIREKVYYEINGHTVVQKSWTG